jgi:hypothetical protein
MLGWVEVPDHLAQPGRTLVSRVQEAMMPAPTAVEGFASNIVTTIVNFPVQMFQPEGYTAPRLAVKAEGYEGDELYRLLRPWNFRPA